MPRPALAFAGFVAVGLVAVLATLVGRSSLVYVAGPPPQTRVADLRAGQEVCQGPVDLPDDAHFDRVRLHVAGPADTLAVTVRDDRGRVLGRGRTPRVSGAATDVTAPVGDIASTRPLRICVSGRGALYGGPANISAYAATLDDEPTIFGLALRLEASDTRRVAELPRIFARASLFNAGWVTPLTWTLLALGLLLGVPALLLVLVRAAYRDTRSTQSHSPSHSDETS